jgi:hypothetical protein
MRGLKIEAIIFLFAMLLPILPFTQTSQSFSNQELLVPSEGQPWFIEDKVTGGILADYGSHYGVKANLSDKYFSKLTFYTALPTFTSGQIDRGYQQAYSPNKTYFAPAEERSIKFDFWGWEEKVKDGELEAVARVFTYDTDVHVVYTIYENKGLKPLTIAPQIIINKDKIESRNENILSGWIWKNLWSSKATNEVETNTVTVTNFFQEGFFGSPLLQTFLKNATTARTIAPSFPIKDATTTQKGFPPFIAFNYTHLITGQEVTVPPGEKYIFYYTIGWDQTPLFNMKGEGSKAKKLAGESRNLIGDNPAKALEMVKADWERFFDALPNPHLTKKNEDIYKLSAAALRNNLYAPRNKMEHWCSVPCKPHFNYFWGWDTPFHAIGYCEWGSWDWLGEKGTWIAKENLLIQFQGQNKESGQIYVIQDDSLGCPFKIFPLSLFKPFLLTSQPPVQPLAINEIYSREKDDSKEFLKETYNSLALYIDFWEKARDRDQNGLFEPINAIEGGADDTPRLMPEWGKNLPENFSTLAGYWPTSHDAVDLNSWLYMDMRLMEEWASELGLEEDTAYWEVRARNLGELIDKEMWSEKKRGWLDLGEENELVEVITPAIWWPAYSGATQNLSRIRLVIEEHLLNPAEFWGEYPIPTVAYNDPNFDLASHGRYWQGQIWLIPIYSALTTLYKYGYEAQAEELRQRIFNLVKAKGGIYETYDPLTGGVGWGSGGVGDPSCFQFSWSSALLEEIALHRYQRTRELTPDDFGFKGWVKQAHVFGKEAGEIFYFVDTNEYEVPLVEVKSQDDKPLLKSNNVLISLTDPFNNLKNKNPKITIKGITFEIKLDHQYEIKDGKVKDLTQQKRTLLIGIVCLIAVIIILVLMWSWLISVLARLLWKKEKKK